MSPQLGDPQGVCEEFSESLFEALREDVTHQRTVSLKQSSLGKRSLLRDVKRPRGKTCSLKRHCLGCLRQVIGLAEKFAANDPERFVWAAPRTFVKHAEKRGGDQYSERQVFYCLLNAELLGIMKPAERVRNGVLRKGFTIEAHENLTRVQGSRCILFAEQRKHSGRSGNQKRHTNAALSATKQNLSAVSSAAQNATDSGRGCSEECTEDSAHRSDYSKDSDLTGLTSAATSTSLTQSNQSALLKRALISQFEKPTANSFFSDSALTKSRPRKDQIHESIGEHFANLTRLKSESVIEVISDKEFDVLFLKNFRNLSELVDCVHGAISELESEPFLGRLSCARVMGKAMEMLRGVYGMNAPRGWVKVMQTLREHNLCESPPEDYFFEPSIPEPSEIFTSPLSTIHVVDVDAAEILEKQPETKSAFVALAQEMGVPSSWEEGLVFMNVLLVNFQNPPADVIRIRDRLAGRVKEWYCKGYSAPDRRAETSITPSHKSLPQKSCSETERRKESK